MAGKPSTKSWTKGQEVKSSEFMKSLCSFCVARSGKVKKSCDSLLEKKVCSLQQLRAETDIEVAHIVKKKIETVCFSVLT